MKRGTKIFLEVVAFITIGTSVFCVWQRENLRAVYMYLTADEASNAAPMRAEIPETPALLEEYDENDFPLRTDGSGTGKDTKRSTPAPSKQGAGDAAASTKEEKTYLQRCKDELYACEADLVSRVSGMRDEVLAKWRALPAEQRTSRKKREMIISG
ncbi:MAG: hypothetical protein IJ949_04115, partial [Oscillospiraceae bacterium]|nr:hypothetical protein [Oscillospiraceae bacterium]